MGGSGGGGGLLILMSFNSVRVRNSSNLPEFYQFADFPGHFCGITALQSLADLSFWHISTFYLILKVFNISKSIDFSIESIYFGFIPCSNSCKSKK